MGEQGPPVAREEDEGGTLPHFILLTKTLCTVSLIQWLLCNMNRRRAGVEERLRVLEEDQSPQWRNRLERVANRLARDTPRARPRKTA